MPDHRHAELCERLRIDEIRAKMAQERDTLEAVLIARKALEVHND